MRKHTLGRRSALIAATFTIVSAAYPSLSVAQKVYFPPQPMPIDGTSLSPAAFLQQLSAVFGRRLTKDRKAERRA